MDFSDFEDYYNTEERFNIKNINIEYKKDKLSNKLNDFIKKFKYKIIDEAINEKSGNKEQEKHEYKEQLNKTFGIDILKKDMEEDQKMIDNIEFIPYNNKRKE